MKKILSILMAFLALNCLLMAGVLGYVALTAKVDGKKFKDVMAVLYPPEKPAGETNPGETTDGKAADGTAQAHAGDHAQGHKTDHAGDHGGAGGNGGAMSASMKELQALLAKHASATAGDQVKMVRQVFDLQMAQLDRRERELLDLQRQVELAKQELVQDRDALRGEKQELVEQTKRAGEVASDAGFQATLQLYTSMPPKQVKDVFMNLADAEVAEFLKAMPPRTASKIIREFAKTGDEKKKIADVLVHLRASQPAGGGVGNGGAAEASSDGPGLTGGN